MIAKAGALSRPGASRATAAAFRYAPFFLVRLRDCIASNVGNVIHCFFCLGTSPLGKLGENRLPLSYHDVVVGVWVHADGLQRQRLDLCREAGPPLLVGEEAPIVVNVPPGTKRPRAISADRRRDNNWGVVLNWVQQIDLLADRGSGAC